MVQKYNGNLPVGSPRFNFYDWVTLDAIDGMYTESIHARFEASTTEQDVWDGTGNIQLLANAEVLSFVSDNAADAFGSTGAQVIIIEGLDADGYKIEETLALSGLTPSTTSQSFWRVNDVIVGLGGSSGANQGRIIGTGSVSGTVVANMRPLYNRSLMSNYTVPVDKIFFSRWALVGGTDTGRNVQTTLWLEPFGGVRIPIVETHAGETSVELTNHISGGFPPLSTLYISAVVNTGTADFALTYNGYVVPKELGGL
jgi:hypothetical protein